MNFTRKTRQLIARLIIVMTLVTAVFSLTACGSSSNNVAGTVNSVDDLPGKKIGVQLGTTGDTMASDYEGDADGTIIERYNKGADAVQALKQGKVNAVIIDSETAANFVKNNNDIKILDESFADEEYAITINKNNSELTYKINTILEKLKADGTLASIMNNYIGDNIGSSPYVPKTDVDRSNGTLTMATNAYFPPYEYYDNGKVVGIDVDVANALCDQLGMNLKIEDMEFDSIITAVSTGKADVGISGFSVTEERKKNIDFSDTYATAQQVIIVQSENAGAGTSIIERFKSDFINEGRYNYLLTGLGNTLLIAACAALMGAVIGFLIAVVRTAHDQAGKFKFLNILANIYLTVIRGTPTMVQLLIIYYVIFGSVNISKIIVAILAFGINSGAYVAEIFRSGIMSIDKGQMEAARSLGLGYKDTMVSIILPQAFKNVLPALANEFIVLLKETSISGYIGLMDLTRGGDIIRSITYDAILPLIGVAIIYLILVMILTSLVRKLERRLRTNER